MRKFLVLALAFLFSSGVAFAETPAPKTLMLTVSWTDPAPGPVEIVLIDPQGNSISEADFKAHNIAVFDALTTPYQKTVAILNPVDTAGWSARIVGLDELGPVTVTAEMPATKQEGPQLQAVSLLGVTADNQLSVQYDVENTDADTTLMIMAGQDATNFNGLPLGRIKLEASGAGTMNVGTKSLSNGTWYVFAMLLTNAPPQQLYAHGMVVAQDGQVVVRSEP